MTTAISPRVGGLADLDAEVACFCCTNHLAEWWEHEKWSDDRNYWAPFCDCPRHHVTEYRDPARWLFVRHDHEFIGGRVARGATVSWPICDECMRSWTRDGLRPDEGRVVPL